MDEIIFYLTGVSVGILFGAHDVVIRGSRSRLDIHSMTTLSLASGYPLVLCFSLIFWGFKPISLQSMLLYIIAGFMNFSVGRSSLYMAIRSVGASGSSILLTLSIVMGAFLGLLVGEEINIWRGIGSALIFVSALVIAWGGEFRRDPRGIFAGLIASTGLALAIFTSRLGNIYGGDPFAGVLIAYSVGLIAEIGFSRGFRLSLSLDKEILMIVLAGILASLGQVARYYALVGLGTSVVTPLQNIRPVVATSLTRVFSRRTMEDPGVRGYFAAAIALVGVILMAL
ncbi:MAG: DMT family transporter [Sulfolobales archaeon]